MRTPLPGATVLLAMLGLAGPTPAWAQAVALADYAEETVVGTWFEVDRRITAACRWPGGQTQGTTPLSCDSEALDAAIAFAEQAVEHIADDGRFHYLIGLAHRHAGRFGPAERALQTAVAQSPDRVEAWMDLGELRARREAWAEADAAFAEVTQRIPTGPTAWVGWLQRAQVAAHRGQADAMARHLRQALRHGFTFRVIQGQPAWKAFLADPRIRPVLEDMIRVYGDEEILESLTP